MEWLLARAEALGGNLSAALRQTITDARWLEFARQDFGRLLHEHPEFGIPRNDDDGSTRIVDLALRMPMSETDDLELRAEESGED